MADEPKAQESANVLKKDENGNLVLTDEARGVFVKRTKEAMLNGNISLPFPCIEQMEILSAASDIDLDNRELYPDFHKFWIDGLYTGIAKMLNVESNFAIPVFDPLALGAKLGISPLPDLDLPTIVASFAAPIPLALNLLEIKPLDIPKFAAMSMGLIIPSPPTLPNLAINLPNVNFEPYGALDISLGLNIAVQLSFFDLFKKLAMPDFWVNFTFPKLFEVVCKTFTKSVAGPFQPGSAPIEVPPITGLAAAAALGTVAADCASFAVTSYIIGAGAVVDSEAASQGYKKHKKAKNPSLNAEAALNGLLPFEPDASNDGCVWVFEKGTRNTYFGDPFIVDYLYALGSHMKEINGSFEIPNYLVEVGNITGKDVHNGWRWSKWSVTSRGYSSHFGSAFDFAYPMKDGNFRISGMNQNSKIITGEIEGLPGISPYLPSPKQALDNSKYDFEVLYEILRWTTEEYIPTIIKEGRISPPQFGKKQLSVRDIFVSLTLGESVYDYFNSWILKNSKRSLDVNFDKNRIHEDHLHFRFCRTRYDSEAMQNSGGKPVYKIPWNVDKLYPNVSRGVEINYVPPNGSPDNGSKTKVVI